MAQDKGRALHLLDDIGHSESLARAGDAEQHLSRDALAHPGHQLFDSLRLIARRLIC